MNINLPGNVIKIISRLEQNDFQAYIVGGCVRDSIMNKIPNDWDICTSALPEEIMKCFQEFRIIETGLQHGTVTIIINDEAYEVTTFRVDGEYSDNRHPNTVKFVTSLKDDLSRRDFTVNALAYNPSTGIVDYFNGIADIERKIIRCVGDPDERFAEDALRIMRALRFASTLNFTLVDSVKLSINYNKKLLKNVAVERLNAELCKLLLGNGVESVLLNHWNILAVFIPEIMRMIGFKQNNPHHHLDVWNHTVQTVAKSQLDIVIRLTMLFHDIAKPICYTQDEYGVGHFYKHANEGMQLTNDIMKRLKFDNATIKQVTKLISFHDAELHPKNQHIKKWLCKIGEVSFRQLIEVNHADALGQSEWFKQEKISQLEKLENKLNNIIEQQQCFSLKDLTVNGKDLISFGVPQGPKIGRLLNKLMDLVINEEIENVRDKLLNKIKEIK